jgi:hypothetical protein
VCLTLRLVFLVALNIHYYVSTELWSWVRSLARAVVSGGSVLVACNSLLDLGLPGGS